MNSLLLFLAVTLNGAPVGTAVQPLHPAVQSGCAAETAQGLRVMDVFTNTERYAAF
jgi:hypothetical protein